MRETLTAVGVFFIKIDIFLSRCYNDGNQKNQKEFPGFRMED